MPGTNRPSTRRSRSTLAVAAACLGLAVWSAAGCKDDQVRVYNAPKSGDAAAPAASPAPAAAAAPATKPESPPAPAPEAPKAGGEEKQMEAGDLRLRVPAGWERDPRQRMMREATFIIGDPAKKTEVVITKLPSLSGGLLENVNRWRGQVGLPPVAEVNENSIRKVKIAGKEASIFDMAGPDAAKPTKRQIQAVLPGDGAVYYVKIIGDAALVGEQQANFERFLSTLEFAK